MLEFGMRLRKLRIQHKMTQVNLADRLGLTKSVISAYETDIRMPSYDIFVQISEIFDVSTDYLLGRESRSDMDLSGLSLEEIDALKQLIKAMKR